MYRRNPRDETGTESKQMKTYNLGQILLRHITKILIFLQLPWRKCLQSQIKRPFSPSPISVLFTVTEEMHTWVVKPKHWTLHQGWRGGGRICSFWRRRLHGAKLKTALKCLSTFVRGCKLFFFVVGLKRAVFNGSTKRSFKIFLNFTYEEEFTVSLISFWF